MENAASCMLQFVQDVRRRRVLFVREGSVGDDGVGVLGGTVN